MKRHTKQLIQLIQSEVARPRLGCEIGCWRGQTTTALLQHFPNTIVIAVDPWNNGGDFSTERANDADVMVAKNEFLLGVSYNKRVVLLEMTSEKAADRVDNHSCDFVFIDACHTYEHVRRDISLWLPKVRAKGILCGHDYNGVGDKRGRFGVKRAVDEAAAEFGYNVLTRPGLLWWWKMK